jgi:hypothetical protein
MLGPQGIQERFGTALAQYVTTLLQASASLAERQQQAMQIYLATVAPAAPPDRGAANAREYENVITAVQSQDTERITAAQAEYTESIRNLQNGISECARSALSQYLTQVQTAWQEAQEKSKASCSAFVDDIKIAFTEVSAADVDAASLAAIGQTLITAAVYVSGSLQSSSATPVAHQVLEATLRLPDQRDQGSGNE